MQEKNLGKTRVLFPYNLCFFKPDGKREFIGECLGVLQGKRQNAFSVFFFESVGEPPRARDFRGNARKYFVVIKPYFFNIGIKHCTARIYAEHKAVSYGLFLSDVVGEGLLLNCYYLGIVKPCRPIRARAKDIFCHKTVSLKSKIKNSKPFDLEFLARSGGFEPTTYRFVAGHSIH